MRALWRNWHRILGTFLREEEGVMGSGQNHDGETVKITAGPDVQRRRGEGGLAIP